MPLCLILHDLGTPPEEAKETFFHGFFGMAPDHWRIAPWATLVGTDLSPGYLLDLLRQMARRSGIVPRMLLVTPVPEEAVTHGLPPEGEAWLRAMQA